MFLQMQHPSDIRPPAVAAALRLLGILEPEHHADSYQLAIDLKHLRACRASYIPSIHQQPRMIHANICDARQNVISAQGCGIGDWLRSLFI